MLMLRSLLLLALSLPSITSHGVTEWKRGAAGIWHHRDDGHARVLGAHGVDNNTQRIQHKQFDTIFDSISANLTLSISTFSNNDPLTVAWTLLNRTSSWDPTHDWIGLFATDIAEGDSDYVDWVWTSTSPTNPQGYGSITFPHLVHLRSKYVVRYYTHTGLGYARIGESMILAPNDMAEPTHIHLALTEDPSRMTVSWTSSSTVYHSVQYRCEFPVSCDRGWQSVDSVFSTYAASDMCGFPANSTSGVAWFIPPGYLHTATLVSLCHPSCRYVYQIGIGDQWTDQYHFVTQKDAGDDVTVSFLAYGDMGEGAAPGASSTAARSLAVIQQCSQPPCVDAVLHIGDISYARGQALIWDTYMNFIQPITSSVPYMINIGNHEYDHLNGAAHDPSGAGLGFHPSWGNYHDDSSGECSVPVYHRFKMPMNGHGIYWYSFETGPVHVMMMSSEHAFDSLSDQYAWMEKDLASVNREITPWIILGGHRPMYCSEQYESDYQVALGMQRDFESLLYKYNVDIAIWGHYHSYERTCAVYNNTCDPKGTVHVVMGMAGASLDNVGYKNLSWSLYHDQVFGYTTLEVSRTTLKLSYYHNVDNALADSVVLTRSCSHVPFALVMRLLYSLSWMWFLVALSLLAMIGSAWTRGYKCSEWFKCGSCWVIWMSTAKTTSTQVHQQLQPQYRY